MRYRFRYIKPEPTRWIECEGENAYDALQNHHLSNDHLGAKVDLEKEVASFAKVELESGETVISRVFNSGIRRRGGVKGPMSTWTYEYAAKMLDCRVEALTDNEWVQEEPEYNLNADFDLRGKTRVMPDDWEPQRDGVKDVHV
jgi:hypothetical protein